MPYHLLPPPPRVFPGQRWINIGLRCAHLVGMSAIGGGFLFTLPEEQWQPFWLLTAASGGLLALLYLWTDATWLLQLKGQVVLLKMALLTLGSIKPVWRAEIFVLIIILSGFFAHAPARVRGYAWGRAVRPCGSSAITEGRK